MRALVLVLATFGFTACCIQLPPPRPQPVPDDDGGALGPPLWPDGTVAFGTTDDNGLVFMPIDVEIVLHRGPQGGCHAYSRMVRSEEKNPMRATLMIAERHHAFGSLYFRATSSCART